MNALIDLEKCREFMTVFIGDKDHQIKLSGTIDDPYFSAKDVCDVLGYKNSKKAIFDHVKPKNKKCLTDLRVVTKTVTTFLGERNEISYNEGKSVYINEPGLYSLIMHSNAAFAEIFQDVVYETILPSIRKYGSYQVESQLSFAMEQLALKDKSFEEETRELKLRAERAEKDAEEQRLRLRSETKRFKEQIKRTLEFNQATKQIEPLEYIYICTTEYYQRQHKFKVGGVQTFELLRSRLTQYNSGESNSEAHFFVYVRKTVSYRSIEQAIKSLLSGFRENQSNELYIMHYDWLIKFVDAILDSNTDFADLVNSNRQQIADDTINKEPTITPPIQLEQIMYLRAGDTPRDLTSLLDSEMRRAIQEAVDSFEPDNNTVKRKEFEDHLLRQSPNVKLDGKKRDAWEMTRALGSSKNPMWRYKY